MADRLDTEFDVLTEFYDVGSLLLIGLSPADKEKFFARVHTPAWFIELSSDT